MAETIETLQKSSRVIQPTESTKSKAYIQDYESEYKRSIEDPEKFWDIFVFMKAAAFCFRVERHKLARYHWEQCSDQVRNKMARTAAAAAWGLGMFILLLVCNLVGNDIITK